MANLKQYKKRRKQLKAEIKETKANLKGLKKQLRGLREKQQHDTVNHLDELLNQQPSFIDSLKRLFKR